MTPKQVLDSFSETLMQDERILSAQERTLLRNLIQHASSAALESQIHAAVNETIASAVGETVAQRAFSILGASIVERIVGSSATIPFPEGQRGAVYAGSPPIPAPPGSVPPGPRPADVPVKTPPTGPPGPGGTATQRPMAVTTAVLERAEIATARCVVLDEFLAPQELQELTRFTLEHQAAFSASEVVDRESEGWRVDQHHRRSRVLMDLGRFRELMLSRIQSALPLVLGSLGMEEFPVTSVEAQITASSNGDFFHCHTDNGDAKVASRQLTFVYFFHQEPRQFEGGELRIYDSSPDEKSGYQTIVPQQNQIVFFPCSAQHEITPVKCPSQLFPDSRFTMNGWLHR